MPEIDDAAVLQVGAVETRYHRGGRGPALVLLMAGGRAGPLGGALFDALCARFRVVAPVPPPEVGAAVPASRWLRDLLDGLGVERPLVVADEPLAGAVLAVMLAAPGRVGGAVALGRDHAEAVEAVVDHLDRSARELALVLIDDAADPRRSAADAADRIAAVLAPGL